VSLSFHLEFDILHEYDPGSTGIQVPVGLGLGEHTVDLLAHLDTGAAFCIFQREFAEILGLAPERGMAQWVSTATGRFLTYGHEASLEVAGLRFDSMVFFAADAGFRRNVLGRRGFLDLFRVAIVHSEGRLYLSPHE